MLFLEEASLDPELRQDLAPAAIGALDGVEVRHRLGEIEKGWPMRKPQKSEGLTGADVRSVNTAGREAVRILAPAAKSVPGECGRARRYP
jgi:hypothetical protein